MRNSIPWGRAAAAALMLAAGTAAAGEMGAALLPAQYGGPSMDGPGDGPGFGGPYIMPGRPRPAAATYHGFRIELAEAGGVDPRALLAAAEHQIDIVDRSGVAPSALALFRRVPIRVTASFVGGGHYGGGREVYLGAVAAGDDRPVLLHEYMHVLEFKSFPGGFHNAAVRRYFDEAQAGGLYPVDSYMMSNPAEFFAVTASCYLNGTVARDPYKREAIRERQPDYYAYLQSLFGPRGEMAAVDRARVTAP